MAIFGWIVCCILLAFFSFAASVLALNNLGRFNIGGVPNSLGTKIGTLCFIAVLGTLWYFLVINVPFTVSIN